MTREIMKGGLSRGLWHREPQLERKPPSERVQPDQVHQCIVTRPLYKLSRFLNRAPNASSYHEPNTISSTTRNNANRERIARKKILTCVCIWILNGERALTWFDWNKLLEETKFCCMEDAMWIPICNSLSIIQGTLYCLNIVQKRMRWSEQTLGKNANFECESILCKMPCKK